MKVKKRTNKKKKKKTKIFSDVSLAALPDQENNLYLKLKQAFNVMSETVESVNGMLKSIRKRTELQKLSDLISQEGLQCDMVKPGRQFSAMATFKVKIIYPGGKEKKAKPMECWLLSDLMLIGERTSSKNHDKLHLKAWFPLEECSIIDSPLVSTPLNSPLSPSTNRLDSARLTSRNSGKLTSRKVDSPDKSNKTTRANKVERPENSLLISVMGALFILIGEDKNELAKWNKKLSKKIQFFKEAFDKAE